MTIAAASFLAATSAGAPAPNAPPTAPPGFAVAMGTALATPPTVSPVPTTGLPVFPATTPSAQSNLVDVAAMPVQPAGLLDPNEVVPAPGTTTTDAPLAPPVDAVAPVKTARHVTLGPPLEARVATATPSPGQHGAVIALTVAQALVVPASAPNQASAAASAPDEAEAEPEQPTSAEPSGPGQPTPFITEAQAPASPPLTAPPVMQSPSGEPGNDEPVAAARTEAASSLVKPAALSDGARESTPAAGAQPQPTGFAERVAAESGDAAQSLTPNAGPAASQPAARSAEAAASAPAPAAPQEPTVAARPGQIGREMGVEIARRLHAGGDELTVRLNPVEMGRIEVRLSFDDRGSLRAFVAAESPAALDMLRRDSADLGRALTDAGVRADAGSFRFDSRSGSGEGSQFWQRRQTANGRPPISGGSDDPSDLQPVYRPLRTSGRVDLVA